MWVLVLTSESGTRITNASFTIPYYNRGDGYYWLYVSTWNQGFICSAPNRNSLWGSTDYYSSMTIWLTRYVAPSTGGGGGWP